MTDLRVERIEYPSEAYQFYFFANWIAFELTFRMPTLLFITERGIWPSSENWNLYYKLRKDMATIDFSTKHRGTYSWRTKLKTSRRFYNYPCWLGRIRFDRSQPRKCVFQPKPIRSGWDDETLTPENFQIGVESLGCTTLLVCSTDDGDWTQRIWGGYTPSS